MKLLGASKRMTDHPEVKEVGRRLLESVKEDIEHTEKVKQAKRAKELRDLKIDDSDDPRF